MLWGLMEGLLEDMIVMVTVREVPALLVGHCITLPMHAQPTAYSLTCESFTWVNMACFRFQRLVLGTLFSTRLARMKTVNVLTEMSIADLNTRRPIAAGHAAIVVEC